MLEIVHDIIEAEKKADELVKSAKERASQRRAETERLVAERLSATRETAKADARERTDTARAEAEELIRKVGESSAAESDGFLERNKEQLDTLVADIADFLAAPEYSRG